MFADLANYFVFGFVDRHIYIFGFGGRAHALAGGDEIDLGKPNLAMLHIADTFADFELASRMLCLIEGQGLFYYFDTTVNMCRYFGGSLIIGGLDAYIHISIYTTCAASLFPLITTSELCLCDDVSLHCRYHGVFGGPSLQW